MRKKDVIILITLIVLFFASTLEAADSTDVFMEGVNFYNQGEYEKAVNSFNSIDELESNIDAMYYQTMAYLELVDIENARKNIEKLDQAGYSFGRIHKKLGSLYLNKEGDFDSAFYNQAKEELKTAVELGISSAEVHSDLAMAYQGLGDQDRAIREYKIAIDKGGNVKDYINLASIYKDNKQLEEAISLYEKALEKDDVNSSVYFNLGEVYYEKEEYERAVQYLHKAEQLRPDMMAIKLKLALSYYNLDNYDRAASQLEEIVARESNNYQAYYYLGDINMRKGKTNEAVYYLKQALKYNPSYVKAYLKLGDFYLNQESPYEAIAQYTNALKYNDLHAPAHYKLAIAYLEVDMKEAAVASLKRTLHLNSDFDGARELLDKLTAE